MTQPTLRYRRAVQWRADGSTAIERATPHEAAIGISFNGRPHTVLMGTPADLEDLAAGFAVTEGVMAFGDIEAVAVEEAEQGFLADVRGRAGKARPRSLEGRSSCGLCGVQRLADAMRPVPTVGEGFGLTHEAVQRAVDELGGRQALGRETRATHAAAFADAAGRILEVREDVGRHNALDKLAGALLRGGADPGDGFIVVTSRCSFEMVEKAARIGCPMIVAVSAPTDLAIAKAEEAGMTLIALARADGHTVFTRPDRLKVHA